MNDILDRLRDIIQNDVGKRGLAADPVDNLITACPGDFRAACQSVAEHPHPALLVVTGFFIPTATPPAGETDGPLGALFLARALVPLGIPVAIATDGFCVPSVAAGLAECGLQAQVPVVTLPAAATARDMYDAAYWPSFGDPPDWPPIGTTLTHLLAIERVGPSHADNRCYTMRGRDITDLMSPAHRLFEVAHEFSNLKTIGIGDGGNEIGMGKLPRELIARNIPNGNLVACRAPADLLIVCGVSNWGGYALAAGIAHLRGKKLDASLFDTVRERAILEVMVKSGPLVDGVTGKPTATVDGLTWEQYAEVLMKMKSLAA
jgi:hypothetical protein